MKNSKILDAVLWGLLALGCIGAANVSYANMMGSPCLYLVIIPICYLVLIAYSLMIASVLIPHAGCKHYFFCAGWGTAFVIALSGSVA